MSGPQMPPANASAKWGYVVLSRSSCVDRKKDSLPVHSLRNLIASHSTCANIKKANSLFTPRRTLGESHSTYANWEKALLPEPTIPIPVYPLPCLFERRGGHRGQQKPFQRLLCISRLLFPDTNDPHGQGFLAHSRLLAWGQERHLPKGQLELRPTPRVTMPGGNLERSARLTRPGECLC